MVLFCFVSFWLARENRKREAGRLQAHEEALENIEFLDLTDKRNPSFVYVY
jgi:hypothetical protein